MKRSKPNKFEKSEFRFWVCFWTGVLICVVSMTLYGVEAVPIVTMTIGGIFGLATGQTVISNYAESKAPEYYFDDVPDSEPFRTRLAPEDK